MNLVTRVASCLEGSNLGLAGITLLRICRKGSSWTYSTSNFGGGEVSDIKAPMKSTSIDLPSDFSPLQEKKVDPILNGSRLAILLKRNAIRYGAVNTLGWITHTLRAERKGDRGLSVETIQQFVDLPIVVNCVRYVMGKKLMPFCFGVFKAMAAHGVIFSNKRLSWFVLKAFGESKEDHLLPHATWFEKFKLRFSSISPSCYEFMLNSLAKESHVSPVVRLNMLRDVDSDHVQFQGHYCALVVISGHPSAAALLTRSELEALEARLAKMAFEPDLALMVYRMHLYCNLDEHERVLQLFETLEGMPLVAVNLKLLTLTRKAPSQGHLGPNRVDARSFTIMLQMTVQVKNLPKSRMILTELQHRPEIIPDEKLLGMQIRHHATQGEVEPMTRLYNQLLEQNWVPSHDVLTSVIVGLNRASKNREADAFFYKEYLPRYKTPKPLVITELLVAHAKFLDLTYFLPLYRLANSHRLTTLLIFEKALHLALHFGDPALLKSTLCDLYTLGHTPSPMAISLTLDFLVRNWPEGALPPNPISLSDSAADLLSDLACDPSDALTFQRSFKRAVFQAAQIRHKPM
ncbi:hypothetical protein L0F63_005380 [Massospora cicadina]|nr:hypothetical protein L0F63_005380 [Massospora cicadina]